MFDKNLYLELTRGSPIGRRLEYFDSVGSTNDVAARLRAPEAAVIAASQTAGRGRGENSFHSPEGGLYMSLFIPDPAEGLTLKAAVAVREAIALQGVFVSVKWLNDLKYGGKKVCGILAQKEPGGAVLGIGVNLRSSFPPELSAVAGDLPPGVDETRLAADIVKRLCFWLPVPTAECAEAYSEHCETVGKTVWCQALGGPAQALSVDGSGRLVTDLGTVSSGLVIPMEENI